MSDNFALLRSVLYTPGSNQKAIDKIATFPVDGVILDLEDAVSPSQKGAARENVAKTLSTMKFRSHMVSVRINPLESDWGKEDLHAICEHPLNAIVIPKVNFARDIEEIAESLARKPQTSDTRIWAMIETPDAVLNAKEISCAPKLAGLIMGTNDLSSELECSMDSERAALSTALQNCVLAARSSGIRILDGVYNKFKDLEGLEQECRQGREFGFDGKTLIHPAQVGIANKVFSPTPEEIDLARARIDAFEEAAKNGSGIAVVDGSIVENLHVRAARKVIDKLSKIEGYES